MSIPVKLLGAADWLAETVGLHGRRLEPERLFASAFRRTGLSDLGVSDLARPLQKLLDACAAEASLSLVGQAALRWDTIRLLSNLLRLRAKEVANPAIAEEKVRAPIFITGLPRSGTTFLHRLLMEDPGNRAPLVFETIYPYPEGRGPDRRAEQVDRQLRSFERIAPEFRSLHPLKARSPQECCEINAHVFRSLRFDTTYQVPSYRRWLDQTGHLGAYRFHRRFLQHLQHQQACERWVLKCPDHLFAMHELRQVYPDARVVFVHRDPVKVLLSLTQLTEVLRRPFTRKLDVARIGPDEAARWHDGTLRMMQADSEGAFAEPICHVHYLDLVSDPLATVEGVYGHFGIDLPGAAVDRITELVARSPNGGYGQHNYRFEDHGLDPEAEHDRFQGYMIQFGIAPESRRRTSVAGQPSGARLSSADSGRD